MSPNITTRVRTATVNPVDWASAKGWRTDLPAGERSVGDGSFIASGRFYFASTNPTIAHDPVPPSTTPLPQGDNWLLELDYRTGGGSLTPFLDLSGDLALSDADRLKTAYPAGTVIADAPGVPCAKFTGEGVNSQPVLTNLIVLNTALYNNHPNIVVPLPSPDRGVSGGHFDFDINYPECVVSGTTPLATYVCVGNQSSCRNVPPDNYVVPSGYTDTCTQVSTDGGTHTCLGRHQSSGCQAYSSPSYTLPEGASEACTQDSSTSTKTCRGITGPT